MSSCEIVNMYALAVLPFFIYNVSTVQNDFFGLKLVSLLPQIWRHGRGCRWMALDHLQLMYSCSLLAEPYLTSLPIYSFIIRSALPLLIHTCTYPLNSPLAHLLFATHCHSSSTQHAYSLVLAHCSFSCSSAHPCACRASKFSHQFPQYFSTEISCFSIGRNILVLCERIHVQNGCGG